MAKFTNSQDVSHYKYDGDLKILYCDKCDYAVETCVASNLLTCPCCNRTVHSVAYVKPIKNFDLNLIKF